MSRRKIGAGLIVGGIVGILLSGSLILWDTGLCLVCYLAFWFGFQFPGNAAALALQWALLLGALWGSILLVAGLVLRRGGRESLPAAS